MVLLNFTVSFIWTGFAMSTFGSGENPITCHFLQQIADADV